MDVLCDEIQMVYERVFMHYDEEGNKIGRLPKEYDLIINIPPGTSKSTIVSIMAPAWSWSRDPTLRHISGSYSGDLATEMSVKSKDIITSEQYQRYFPEVRLKKDEQGKTNYKNVYGGQRYATSVGGTITGIHAHIISMDDPINTKEAVSIAGLKEANDFFDSTLPTRKVDKMVTPIILVMQRLASKDPTGHLLSKKGLKIRHVCLPASIVDNKKHNVSPKQYADRYINGYLDPLRMPQSVLDDMHISLGSAGYAGQFDQRPVPAGGLIWKKWFIEVPDELFPHRSLMDKYGTDWDLAYTKDDDNSASAYVTAGKIGANIYIDDVGWDWLEFPQLIAYMRTKAAPHHIEAKASGKSAKSTLSQNGIVAIEVPVTGGDKIARANMATPPAEAGMVYIRKSIADKVYNDSKQGILLFPKGPNTDVADVIGQALQRLSKRGTITEGNANSEGDYNTDEEIDLLAL